MALLALRFSYTPITTSEVFNGSNRFYVNWINTVTHAAQVITLQPFVYGAAEHLIQNDMSPSHHVCAVLENPYRCIPCLLINRSYPKPAGYSLENDERIDFYFMEKSSYKCQGWMALKKRSSRSWFAIPSFTVCAFQTLSALWIAKPYAKLKQVSIAFAFTTVAGFYKIVDGHHCLPKGNADRAWAGS